MRKLRIAFVTPEFTSEKYFSGGIATCYDGVSKALSQAGHAVHVVVPSDRSEDVVQEGFHLHRLAPRRLARTVNLLTFNGLWQTTRRLEFAWQAYRKVSQLHRRQPFDIVEFTSHGATGFFAVHLGLFKTTVFADSYGPAWHTLSGARRNADVRCSEWMEKRQLKRCGNVHAPSLRIVKLLEENWGIHNVSAIRMPFFRNIVAPDESVYRERVKGGPYLLYFGRFQMHKGFHLLAQALPEVFRALPDCRAVCVGADRPSPLGPSMADYARARCSGFEDRLVVLDALPHAQLYPVIARAKLVVLPSLIDNMPNTLMEAIAFGRPVVGTYGASFDEVLEDGCNGFLVPSGDAAALAEKIVEAWKHPRLDQIGKAAARKAEEFAPENVLEARLRYYEEVIGDQ